MQSLKGSDPALLEAYRPLAAASIAEFGGRYTMRGGDPKMFEGNGPPQRSDAGIRRPRAGDGVVLLATISSRAGHRSATGQDKALRC